MNRITTIVLAAALSSANLVGIAAAAPRHEPEHQARKPLVSHAGKSCHVELVKVRHKGRMVTEKKTVCAVTPKMHR